MKKTITHKGKNPVLVEVKHKTERVQRDWMRGVFMETARHNTLSFVGNNLNLYGGGTIIDCGAHIGNHTLFFSVVCKSQMVYSFEPYRPSLDHLEHNVFELNKLENVKTFNIALGDKKRRVGINKQTDDILNQIDYKGKDVQMLRLDAALEGLEFPGGLKLIKIDVDGSELITLKGAKKTIKAHKPDIIIECATDGIFEDVDPFLRELGYKPAKTKAGNIFVLNSTPTYIYRHG